MNTRQTLKNYKRLKTDIKNYKRPKPDIKQMGTHLGRKKRIRSGQKQILKRWEHKEETKDLEATENRH